MRKSERGEENFSSPLLYLGVFLALAGVCFLCYANSLPNPFIWDDTALILKNPLIKNLRFWPRAFAADLYAGTLAGGNFYRPLQTLSYLYDYYFWQFNPLGYHLTNIVLHLFVSFAVFLLLQFLYQKITVAFAASILFATHPVNSEAVTYISGRADSLCALFLLISLLFFIRSQKKDATKLNTFLWCLALTFFALALLSKELAVVFPLVIMAWVFYYLRDNLKKPYYFLKTLFPFFALDFIYVVLRFSLLKFPTVLAPELTRYPLFLRAMLLPKIIFTYIKLLILPLDLHMSRTLVRPVSFGGIFLSWILIFNLCAVIIYILVYKKERKRLCFLLCWTLAFFIPQSGLFVINAFVAEHFIYLASISFFGLLSFLGWRYLKKMAFILALCGLVLFYSLLTISRNLEWRTPVIFYQKIIRFSPQSFMAHNNLGLEYEKSGALKEAIAEYQEALRLRPRCLEAHSNLANAYQKVRRFSEAEREYRAVERLAPYTKAGEVQNNLGTLYESAGRLREALTRYELALRLDPNLYFIHFNLARIYFLRQDTQAAVGEIIKSLSLNSANPKETAVITDYLSAAKNLNCAVSFYNNLGVKFAEAGFLDAAVISFLRSIELVPDFTDAYFNLALTYEKKGLRKQAIRQLKTVLKINPGHLQAGRLLAGLKK